MFLKSKSMHFKLTPVIDTMIELYKIKDLEKRFKTYLSLLQDSQSGDMILAIDAYNPMAKEHVSTYLKKLKEVGAEQIITQTLKNINTTLDKEKEYDLKVVLNVADNIGGAWTNRYTTDYKYKFDDAARRKRGFCTPIFWIDEMITPQLIIEKTCASVYRSIYQTKHGDPSQLTHHINQEVSIYKQGNQQKCNLTKEEIETFKIFVEAHYHSDDYNVIFNFFYGDRASDSLGYSQHGIYQSNGFEYCKYLAFQKSNK